MHISELRSGIAEERVLYAHILAQRYGKDPGFDPTVSLDVALSTFEVDVEYFNLETEIHYAQRSFDRVVRGELPSPIELTRYPDRSYLIEIDEGTLDCVSLASEGVLPYAAYDALGSSDVMQNHIFLSELGQLLCHRYDFNYERSNRNLRKFAEDPRGFLAEHEPHSEFPFEIAKGPNGAQMISLFSVSAVVNIIERDYRVLDTHLSSRKVQEQCQITSATVNDLVRSGTLQPTYVSFLNPSRPTMYFNPENVDDYVESRSYISMKQLIAHLKPKGVICSPVEVQEFLHTEGYVQGNQRGQRNLIPPEDIPLIIAHLQADERYSMDYRRYCLEKDSDPELHFDDFERDYEAFMERNRLRKAGVLPNPRIRRSDERTRGKKL